MSRADELFNEMGYGDVVNGGDGYCLIKKNDEVWIGLYKYSSIITKIKYGNRDSLTFDELIAINLKLKELSWLND